MYITHVCSFVLYSGLWLSGLSSLFLRQKYWSMLKVVGSNPATGSYSSTFILSIQIRNFPTPLPYHTVCMCSCPTLVKSAILPKTTCLCSSLTVILLWVGQRNETQLLGGLGKGNLPMQHLGGLFNLFLQIVSYNVFLRAALTNINFIIMSKCIF